MVKTFILQHRQKILLYTFFLVFASALFFLPHIANAAAAAPTDPDTLKVMKEAQTNFNIVLGYMSALLWPVVYLIGGLLDNELIFGGPMGDALLSIWVQMRNLVNIVFVLVLLAIAIYNVLGLGESGPVQALQLKAVLPKFITALIVVNFSFLGAKIFLDFTNVLTQAVFALPSNISTTTYDPEKFKGMICGKDRPFEKVFCDGTEYNERAKKFFENIDRRNIAVSMALSMGKLSEQKFVGENVEDIFQLIFNILFGVTMYGVYLVSFLTLFIVLIGRIAVMWVIVALSPLWALTLVVPLESIGGGGINFSEKLMKHAFAPLIIGLFLSIGYIMMDTMNNFNSVAGGFFSSIPLDLIDPNSVVSGILNLQQFLVAAAIAVVVFTGVFAATEGTVTAIVTDKIRDYTKEFGGFLTKLPTLVPLVPTAEGGKKSLFSIFQTLQPRKWEQQMIDRERGVTPEVLAARNKHGEDFYKDVASKPGIMKDEEVQNNMRNELIKEGSFSEDDKKAIKTADSEKLAGYMTSEQAPQKLKEELAKRGLTSERALAEKIREGNIAVEAEEEGKEGKAESPKPGSAKATADYEKKNAEIRVNPAGNSVSAQNEIAFRSLPEQVKNALTFVGQKQPQVENTKLATKLAAVTKMIVGMRAGNVTDVNAAITELNQSAETGETQNVVKAAFDEIKPAVTAGAPDPFEAIKAQYGIR